MASVMAGVNSAPVMRLKRTNEHIAPKYWTMKNGLDKTLDSTKNFSNYKDMLKTINPPCVPFFGECRAPDVMCSSRPAARRAAPAAS